MLTEAALEALATRVACALKTGEHAPAWRALAEIVDDYPDVVVPHARALAKAGEGFPHFTYPAALKVLLGLVETLEGEGPK